MLSMSNRFPWYLEEQDHFLMAALVPNQLAAWRNSVAYHKGLPTVEAKLADRKYLEQAFDVLKMAWANAMNQPAAMAA